MQHWILTGVRFKLTNILITKITSMKKRKNTLPLDHWLNHPHDPFAILGPKYDKDQVSIRVFSPNTQKIKLVDNDTLLTREGNTDYFTWHGAKSEIETHYTLSAFYDNQQQYQFVDPYCFTPVLSDFDLHLFGQGRHWEIYNVLGANFLEIDGISGILFAVWAPTAKRISLVGNFNNWDGRKHLLRSRGSSGVWELFIPGMGANELYKFEIADQANNIYEKNDPYAKQFEVRPKTAALTTIESEYQWNDQNWIDKRQKNQWQHEPMSVYELHLGSWRRDAEHQFLNYRTIAHELVEYIKELGFTHIELLPISEHPLDASWGYQTLGYFAPTSRFGSIDDFKYFVDYCHQHDIGIILDWVPAHFPKDAHGLGRFDGSALYEHEDPKKGEHRDWGTFIFNYGRNEVSNFLVANALYWIKKFHIDGLRVDAVASMLYLDYSREPGDWVPNKYGGNENLEAVEFVKLLNNETQTQFPGVLMIAEESTSWPSVSRPTWLGGLGFSMKWNMGWMHDTLSYFSRDTIYRHYHHENLTFGLLYAFTENFTLPFSHDEVVHGKGSMFNKMPGDEWQKFANLRLLYTYMFTYPGKKLLFMGSEFAQYEEWDEDATLSWQLLEYPNHQGVKTLLADLNNLYKTLPALHYHDFEVAGFEWIDCHDSEQSIISFLRKYNNQTMLVVLNFTPVSRENYRLGVPAAGTYKEIFNSDSNYYCGSNVGNNGYIHAEEFPWMNRVHSISLNLPPLGGLILTLS